MKEWHRTSSRTGSHEDHASNRCLRFTVRYMASMINKLVRPSNVVFANFQKYAPVHLGSIADFRQYRGKRALMGV